ncbi:hypothetical protein V6M93_00735 [Pectobacterium brasiliense]|uniref:hypothetical protein n=1 Tax=Pectobacterium TaxID=122277 RepID=UPI000E415349|nr:MULTISPECIES: hypothetical protein [Pectobacterium]MCH5048855.1 hypothetical protein [Pectobacterium aquaticum]MCL6387153.1 hypothetical protein [Pectobacterium carotovorum subsp. carotovorum]MDY4348881.1 hypothetical protein [Pectobacterium brasiliense]QRN36433.1 hypothetical protein IHJ54_16870 [Pectobacterium brasiliense]
MKKILIIALCLLMTGCAARDDQGQIIHNADGSEKISFWRTTGLIVGVPLLILSAFVAAESDDEDSKNDYPGRCRHEYDIAADGSRCGLRAADSRLGGY